MIVAERGPAHGRASHTGLEDQVICGALRELIPAGSAGAPSECPGRTASASLPCDRRGRRMHTSIIRIRS
jgi:hypothetical protein